MGQVGIYVHFPFCKRKCEYCDFNSRVGSAAERARYLRALLAETARPSDSLAACPAERPSDSLAGCQTGSQGHKRQAATVYFGGGTPTLYPSSKLAEVLTSLAEFSLAPDTEITVEANPGTVSVDSLRELRETGFNRLSLGVQSLSDPELRLLGRIHSAEQARQAVRDAREAGFENLSVDLIRGLPGQRLEDWQRTLEGAIDLAPEHISVYGLALEHGTPLHDKVTRGQLPPPRTEQDAQWIAWTVERLHEAGYRRYEISNYAKPGFECRHNINYWRNGEYVGFGAGAWSYLGGERRRNVADPTEYTELAIAGEGLTTETERLTLEAALGETIMLGLRMVEGVSRQDIIDRLGVDVFERHGELIARLVGAGLMVQDPERLRLTFEGMLVQSAIALEFLP